MNSQQKASWEPNAIVIFGGSGDLTRRKLMPALFTLERDGLLTDDFHIVAFARSPHSDDAFRQQVGRALEEHTGADMTSDPFWPRFAARVHYHTGQYDDPSALVALKQRLAELSAGRPARALAYLALPPSASESVLGAIKAARESLPGDEAVAGRIMIEKPFGMDLESARRLNGKLAALFDEPDVYRIDHYIAKDLIRSLLVFRFANAIWESLWSRQHIDNVQITAAEKIGIEGRGAYYDAVGVVRDMVQAHALQVLALVAMEPPLAGDVESVRDRKRDVFRQVAPIRREDFAFGQYRGYREEPNVAPHSPTPTFVALRLFVNNWRWQGVPFYVRSGKRMARKFTEVVIQFKRVPLCVLPDEAMCPHVQPNALVIRIQPNEGIRLRFVTMKPGREDEVSTADLGYHFAAQGLQASEAYERVILDALRGNPALFWRADSIEEAWRVVTPLLAPPCEEEVDCFPNYEPGSWGPEAADELLEEDHRSWFRH